MDNFPVLDEVRWGIIGCGDVTEIKSGPALQKVAHSRLVNVMRRDGDKARDYAQRHNVPRFTDDAQGIIDDPEVNIVYVATPPDAHEPLALRVAAAGKPCYVEKPMARSYAECRRMNAAFRAANLPLFVAYYRRALPRFVRAKQIIESKQLGEITRVDYRMLQRPTRDSEMWRLNAQIAGAGLFLDLGSHTLDVLDWLLGQPQNVNGHAENRGGHYDVEDYVELNFQLANGATGHGLWNFNADQSADVITVTGTRGNFAMSTFGSDPIRLTIDGATQELEDVMPMHVQQPLIAKIVADLRGGESAPSTGESAARTSRVMDVALERFYHGRDDAFWQRSNWRNS